MDHNIELKKSLENKRKMAEIEDDFPYKRNSFTESPAEFFKRILDYCPHILMVKPDEGQQTIISPAFVKRLSVFSRTSKNLLLKHFFLTFNEKELLIIKSPKDAYNKINILTDYFTEEARVRDIGAYERISPFQYWQRHKHEIRKAEPGSLFRQRELLWRKGPKEARQGKITNYLSLFDFLDSKFVLDPSAAWGDRLIAALAAPSVEVYTGVDPHSRLPPGWEAIIENLGPLTVGKHLENFVMLNEPFEPPETKIPHMGKYDTVLVSTAPLFGDIYDVDNEKQAVVKHGASWKTYVNGFLMPYTKKCIKALCDDGFLCITVLDRSRDEYFITEFQLLIVELLGKGKMVYRGVIWWEGDSGSLVPWWIFQKSSSGEDDEHRLEEAMKLFEPYSRDVIRKL